MKVKKSINKTCLILLKNIRDRAFHWENLYKIRKKDNPRITAKINNVFFGTLPEFIETFLDDLIVACDKNLKSIHLEYEEFKKCGGRAPSYTTAQKR